MTYEEAVDYLYNALPAFERNGSADYKPDLETSLRLSELMGNPHKRLHASIHIAGTNGKGTTAHTLAAILQKAGYKTGLYTSPHLTDMRERIRIDGRMINREEVVGFVERWLAMVKAGEHIKPTFFELTTVMAFEAFVRHGVDVAVIETGLGGRLDTTNIITPRLSVITNVSADHTALLGDTIEQIAREKAGIIKPRVPVVIGEAGEAGAVFRETAAAVGSPIIFAEESGLIASAEPASEGGWTYRLADGPTLHGALGGDWQPRNTATILAAVNQIRAWARIPAEAVAAGLAEVESLTGLRGRWTRLTDNPTVVYDTGHNPGAWQYIARELKKLIEAGRPVGVVLGFVADKDVDSILSMLPHEASYFFTAPRSSRALSADRLAFMGATHGLIGEAYPDVNTALEAARKKATPEWLVLVGGSNYMIGELTL